MEKTYTLTYKEHNNKSELNEKEQDLIAHAEDAMKKAYAPYSNFQVGAAILFEDGTIITGNNQENAAYPSGLCAERTAMFYAQSQYPDKKILALAIASSTAGIPNVKPVYPCGSCRQVLLESEHRNKAAFKIFCCGTSSIVEMPSASSPLPLHFVFEK